MSQENVLEMIEYMTTNFESYSKNIDNKKWYLKCYIETKNHLYSGYYKDSPLLQKGIITLTNGIIKDLATEYNTPGFEECHINFTNGEIISFSYEFEMGRKEF